MWSEWLRLTRLQWSGKIAFHTEASRWESAHIANPEDVDVNFSESGGSYRTSLANHIATVSDPSLFCELILHKSWALLESHSKLVQYICDEKRWSEMDNLTADQLAEIDDTKLSGGIEAWSQKLMNCTGQKWEQVFGGREGLIEISIVRNALAHGYNTASKALLDAAETRGVAVPYASGDDLKVSFELLHTYRGRIRSFCRIVGDGAFHLGRGTHRIR